MLQNLSLTPNAMPDAQKTQDHQDDVDGRASVTKDEQRVLRGG